MIWSWVLVLEDGERLDNEFQVINLTKFLMSFKLENGEILGENFALKIVDSYYTTKTLFSFPSLIKWGK